MVGHILGGIATSLLFLAFESWLVAEHNKRGFEQQWLSITLSKAIFLGNGRVAILAGLFGNLLVGSLSMGPVAPFDAASIFLAIGMAIIISSWTENYGDSSESKDLMTQFRGAAVAVASDENIALLGAIQSLFEGSMYTFVFLQTPALIPNGPHIVKRIGKDSCKCRYSNVDLYGLLEGLDIAVKHLSKTSRKGLDEYMLAMFYLIWT
ncbi:unnamed protein product [Lactuca saligna]|uniref:Uncharacterized protein n=1 Tax=Lactuca saligna TaxID=75948 RepID=A0AA35Z1C2_LACSI|nr:unnamed protein product [Lactuca saligna]